MPLFRYVFPNSAILGAVASNTDADADADADAAEVGKLYELWECIKEAKDKSQVFFSGSLLVLLTIYHIIAFLFWF
ncbi:hypothetical protein BHM03_00047640 [Ensete ventricosum]|nr:hypothetical protein BHM03_00047640 [Ensete ventricosum]